LKASDPIDESETKCSRNVSAGLRYDDINKYAKGLQNYPFWVRVKINDEHFTLFARG
jgi:hypothetical protein